MRPRYIRNSSHRTKTDDGRVVVAGDWLPTRDTGLHELLGGAAVIGNLEFAVSNDTHFPEKAHSAVLSKKSHGIVAKSGFAAINVANIHILGAGQ